MQYQATFRRYELKYLISQSQCEAIKAMMAPYMSVDQYGLSTIRNVYFDTDNYRLIRRSMEKPLYKEKLRLRSYRAVGAADDVFLELKKKYQSVVYMRRLFLPDQASMDSFALQLPLPLESLIGKEIEYFRAFYGDLRPTVFLSYDREAWYAKDGSDFRVTFDRNILYRRTDVSLQSDVCGVPILHPQQTMMEIKTSGGIPLWMTRALSAQKIYKTSFSKYGTAFTQMLETEKRRVSL